MGIESWEEYGQLDEIVQEAEEALVSGNSAGIHYSLTWVLRKYGVWANGREDSVKQAKQLLREFELWSIRLNRL